MRDNVHILKQLVLCVLERRKSHFEGGAEFGKSGRGRRVYKKGECNTEEEKIIM